jgi:hypothetical protein
MNTLARILLVSILCVGCSAKQKDGQLEDPVAISRRYAENLKVSLSGYEVHSMLELQGGNNSNGIRSTDQDEYARRFFEKLGGRKYWEVCFKKIKPVLGGMQCYYVDKSSKQVLMGYLAQ